MAKQTVNIGTSANDGSGDPARTAFNKLNLNNNEIYNYLGDGTNLNKLGAAAFKNTGTQAGNVMEVGAFGLGGNQDDLGSTIDSVSEPTKFGWFKPNDQWNPIPDSYLVGVSIRGGGAVAAQLLLKGFGGNGAWIRSQSALNSWGAAVEILTQGNTTTDSNGFIKRASPIAKLFADKIELNDEAQRQNVEFEKLGVGDYLIKGSSGFAQEGWYVETPKDANGNALFSVIYTTLENGDISVKTYKKKFDLETASVVADLSQPVDITANRWVDLRLQELPQPEIEEPKPITPPDFQPTGLAEAVATVMESYNDTEQ